MTGPGLGAPATRSLSVRVAGLSIAMSFGPGREGLAAEAFELWRHLVAPDPPAVPDVELTFVTGEGPVPPGATVVAPSPTETYALSGAITRAVLTSLIGRRLLLHAGTIDTPRLGVVVLVGPSGAGKSTATARLGAEGAYLSDELTIIDPDTFEVTGYPKPVSRSIPGSRAKRDVSLPSLHLMPACAGGSPDLIVLLHRDRGNGSENGPPGLERMPLASALLRLIGQTSSLNRVPGGLAALARLIDSAGGALRARYHEASELAELLDHAPAPISEWWAEVEACRPSHDVQPRDLMLAPFDQALALETGVLVLARREAGHLEGLLGVIWELLRVHGGLSLDLLQDLVAEEIGPHPNAARRVRSAADRLISGGWVIRA